MVQRARLRWVHGYRWYDWGTGAIDLCALAEDATRTDAQRFSEPPSWLSGVPESLPGAVPTDLAEIDATARRCYVHRTV